MANAGKFHVNNRVIYGNYLWFRMTNYFSYEKLFVQAAQNFAQSVETRPFRSRPRNMVDRPVAERLAGRLHDKLSFSPTGRRVAGLPP